MLDHVGALWHPGLQVGDEAAAAYAGVGLNFNALDAHSAEPTASTVPGDDARQDRRSATPVSWGGDDVDTEAATSQAGLLGFWSLESASWLLLPERMAS